MGRGRKQKPKSSCTIWCNRIQVFIRGLYCNCCVVCKGKEDLEFAHLEKTQVWHSGRGKFKRVKDILENPDKYTLLCNDCHHDFDTDKDDRKRMFPYIQSVEEVAAKSPELLARFDYYKKELPPIVV